MSEYGKLFRKKDDQVTTFTVKSYNPNEDKYFELINKARKERYRQVIINSKLMTDILFTTIDSGGVILKINMSDNTDQEINDDIKTLISKLREDKLLFVKLKEQLEWVSESGSIDISSIEIYFQQKRYEVYSNGIITGNNIFELFNDNIQKVLEEYFNV